MAIGLGYILGFNFPENFNYPYMSKSITDFWRRWHITLSAWFREYVYIPLGGNRRGKYRTLINLLIVWFLTGLWHGASWNFVLWGLYFALLLIVEKTFLNKLLLRVPSFISHIYALIFIVFGWFIFIYCDLENPISYLSSMFTAPAVSQVAVYDLVRSLMFLAVLCVASTNLPHKLYDKVKDYTAIRVATVIILPISVLVCTAYLVDSSYNPFLYFRF